MFYMSRSRKVCVAGLVAGACLLGARHDQWQIIGPGGGGAQFYPAISPHDPKKVLVACDMTGAYLTEDAGANWRMFNLRGTTRFFVWDPNDANTVYAGSTGLFRSKDGGRSWALVFPSPARVSGVRNDDDHASGPILVDGKAAQRATALAVEPGNSRRLHMAIGTSLLTTDDAGATWRVERDFPAAVRRIWATRDGLYVAAERSIFHREKGEWTEGEPAPARFVDIAGAPPVFYMVAQEQAAISDDGGKSWRTAKLPGTDARLQAVAVGRKHPDTAYISVGRLKGEDGFAFGVAKTTDRGRTWQMVWKESNAAASNVHDAWITPRFGPGWGGYPLHLAVADNDPDICYATDMGRTMRTLDGGKTWDGVYSRRAGEGWTSTGLDVTTNYGVHFDPFDLKRMFITYTDIGAFRSEDGGKSWISATEGVPHSWVNTTYWMEFDPQVRGRVWAVASGTHDLPRPKMWREAGAPRQVGGVLQSSDGGRTWQVSNQGMPETAATHILLDPRSPRDARVLYVAAFGKGVYKSVDSGATWTLKNAGIEGAEPFAWRLSRDRNGGLYLVVARRSENGSIGDAGDGAVYFSSDGAEHWTKLKLPEGVNGPNAVSVDPGDARRLYLSVWQRKGAPGSGGVFLSADGGATWKPTLPMDQHVYDVTIDPKNPQMLYACGFQGSAWRSTDRGETWQRIRGYNFKWGHRVIPDPADSKMIYITTYGGSVWHGPAAGDSNALEDITGPFAGIR
jgi:photosystem II stability/assembly factor-like uncharacterized protein